MDNLSYFEQLDLHLQMQKRNMMQEFYDDYLQARKESVELIKKSILTRENVQKYFNREKSLELGVPIYELKKVPFYVLVKSLMVKAGNCLTKEQILERIYCDAASYSLDSSFKLNTFQNPSAYFNMAYDVFDSDQVIHIHPTDAYTYFERGEEEYTTCRLNVLMSPKELVEKSSFYNEILIAQRNREKDDELNNSLDTPSFFAIYCYDNIKKEDIMSAKNLGVGIILVHTSTYKKTLNEDEELLVFDTDAFKVGRAYLKDVTEDGRRGRI